MASTVVDKKLSSLSVFFPCFNEEKNVPLFLEQALEIIPKVAKKFEIIVINDGSSDNTKRIAREWSKHDSRIKVFSHKNNQGYGASLQTGFRASQMDWVFFTDGDLQFDLHQIKLLVEHARSFDAVIGFRKNRAEGFGRSRNAYLYKVFVDLLFRLHVKDIDCAFKLLKKSAVDKVDLESKGAFISAELLYKLKKQQVAFKQIGVDHYPRKFGKPTGSNISVIIKACLDALKLYLHMKFNLFSVPSTSK